MSPNPPVDEPSTSYIEPLGPDVDVLTSVADDDVPARRLLAHDLQPIVWDEDGEAPLPPPD